MIPLDNNCINTLCSNPWRFHNGGTLDYPYILTDLSARAHTLFYELWTLNIWLICSSESSHFKYNYWMDHFDKCKQTKRKKYIYIYYKVPKKLYWLWSVLTHFPLSKCRVIGVKLLSWDVCMCNCYKCSPANTNTICWANHQFPSEQHQLLLRLGQFCQCYFTD